MEGRSWPLEPKADQPAAGSAAGRVERRTKGAGLRFQLPTLRRHTQGKNRERGQQQHHASVHDFLGSAASTATRLLTPPKPSVTATAAGSGVQRVPSTRKP